MRIPHPLSMRNLATCSRGSHAQCSRLCKQRTQDRGSVINYHEICGTTFCLSALSCSIRVDHLDGHALNKGCVCRMGIWILLQQFNDEITKPSFLPFANFIVLKSRWLLPLRCDKTMPSQDFATTAVLIEIGTPDPSMGPPSP